MQLLRLHSAVMLKFLSVCSSKEIIVSDCLSTRYRAWICEFRFFLAVEFFTSPKRHISNFEYIQSMNTSI